MSLSTGVPLAGLDVFLHLKSCDVIVIKVILEHNYKKKNSTRKYYLKYNCANCMSEGNSSDILTRLRKADILYCHTINVTT